MIFSKRNTWRQTYRHWRRRARLYKKLWKRKYGECVELAREKEGLKHRLDQVEKRQTEILLALSRGGSQYARDEHLKVWRKLRRMVDDLQEQNRFLREAAPPDEPDLPKLDDVLADREDDPAHRLTPRDPEGGDPVPAVPGSGAVPEGD